MVLLPPDQYHHHWMFFLQVSISDGIAKLIWVWSLVTAGNWPIWSQEWEVCDIALYVVDINFRDGAGCFGNNDGVPPAEVNDIKNNTVIIIKIYHTHHYHGHQHHHQNDSTKYCRLSLGQAFQVLKNQIWMLLVLKCLSISCANSRRHQFWGSNQVLCSKMGTTHILRCPIVVESFFCVCEFQL